MQCDTCELWFHYLCVGLRQGDISENEDYKCRTCVPPPPRVNGVVAAEDASSSQPAAPMMTPVNRDDGTAQGAKEDKSGNIEFH